jgi:aspartyl-tRNA(Asn)/glutamyl-tRNA(Gln) amidotransferase subunit C
LARLLKYLIGNKMSLSEKDVEYVARLARLELSPEEKQLYARQLTAILEYAQRLDELDTSGVEPCAHVLPLKNVTRLDEITTSMSRDQILANAPQKSKGCFKVPKIIEEGTGGA